jgi:hypothetical protein
MLTLAVERIVGIPAIFLSAEVRQKVHQLGELLYFLIFFIFSFEMNLTAVKTVEKLTSARIKLTNVVDAVNGLMPGMPFDNNT